MSEQIDESTARDLVPILRDDIRELQSDLLAARADADRLARALRAVDAEAQKCRYDLKERGDARLGRCSDIALQALAAHTTPPTCAWTLDRTPDGDPLWKSACGETWGFMAGGPKENRVRFCHGCGRPIVEEPQPISVGPVTDEVEE